MARREDAPRRGRRASLVDVPGHERFVKNMVSGSTGVDAFLLVVAADDGVMPQTREHLDILRILGVEQGVVALSKTDAVDDEPVELDELDADTVDRRSGDLVRLPVDRSFVLKGIGIVVTGTLWSGEIRPGDVLHTASGHRPRVRTVQNHGRHAQIAYPGAR